jgi:hypothetical protein
VYVLYPVYLYGVVEVVILPATAKRPMILIAATTTTTPGIDVDSVLLVEIAVEVLVVRGCRRGAVLLLVLGAATRMLEVDLAAWRGANG